MSIGLHKFFKNPPLIFPRDPGAVIGHFDREHVGLAAKADRHSSVFRGGVAQGVGKQIGQDARQERLIAVDRRQGLGMDERQLFLAQFCERTKRIHHRLGPGHRVVAFALQRQFSLFHFRDIEQILHHHQEVLARPPRALQKPLEVRPEGRGAFVENKIEAGEDVRERRF